MHYRQQVSINYPALLITLVNARKLQAGYASCGESSPNGAERRFFSVSILAVAMLASPSSSLLPWGGFFLLSKAGLSNRAEAAVYCWVQGRNSRSCDTSASRALLCTKVFTRCCPSSAHLGTRSFPSVQFLGLPCIRARGREEKAKKFCPPFPKRRKNVDGG